MDGQEFHRQKRKEVLALCKELKSNYKEDWKFVMPVLFPDSWSYLKQIKRMKK